MHLFSDGEVVYDLKAGEMRMRCRFYGDDGFTLYCGGVPTIKWSSLVDAVEYYKMMVLTGDWEIVKAAPCVE